MFKSKKLPNLDISKKFKIHTFFIRILSISGYKLFCFLVHFLIKSTRARYYLSALKIIFFDIIRIYFIRITEAHIW